MGSRQKEAQVFFRWRSQWRFQRVEEETTNIYQTLISIWKRFFEECLRLWYRLWQKNSCLISTKSKTTVIWNSIWAGLCIYIARCDLIWKNRSWILQCITWFIVWNINFPKTSGPFPTCLLYLLHSWCLVTYSLTKITWSEAVRPKMWTGCGTCAAHRAFTSWSGLQSWDLVRSSPWDCSTANERGREVFQGYSCLTGGPCVMCGFCGCTGSDTGLTLV